MKFFHKAQKEKSVNGPESPQRRAFLVKVIAFLGGVIAFVLGGSGGIYFLSPGWRRKKVGWIEVGLLKDVKGSNPVHMDYVERERDGWQVINSPNSVWILRQGNDLIAYDPHCTHLGCLYNWNTDKQEFLCPCHGGVYSKEGQVLAGPPPHALYRYPVKVEKGVIYVLPEVQA